MSAYWLIRGEAELDARLQFLKEHLKESGQWPIRLEVKKHVNPRTLSQNALFWMWCTTLSERFRVSKEDMHDILCHKFLGYETKLIGSTEVTKLKTTKRLGTGDFGAFMDKIDQWAVDHGVKLTYPENSEYAKYKEAQA